MARELDRGIADQAAPALRLCEVGVDDGPQRVGEAFPGAARMVQETLREIGDLLVVPVKTLVEQRPLAGEGVVQAALREPRHLCQASRGGRVVAVGPELLHGAVDDRVVVEGPRPAHDVEGSGIGPMGQ